MTSLKKKSKRRTTRLRTKIEKRVNAHNRKQRKLAKKTPQWKSKHPKDPGIPNNFPDKEKILLQIQAQREEKRDSKPKKGLIAEKDAVTDEQMPQSDEQFSDVDDSSDYSMDNDGNESAGSDAEDEELGDAATEQSLEERRNVLAAVLQDADEREKKWKKQHDDEFSDDQDEPGSMDLDDEFASLRDPDTNDTHSNEDTRKTASSEKSRKMFNKDFERVLTRSDVILYVVDARDPVRTRSRAVEMQIAADTNKRLIFVMNKADLIPSNVLKAWMTVLCGTALTVPFMAAQSGSHAFEHKFLTSRNTAAHLIKALKGYAAKKNLKRSLTVGIVGYPNVGKSSIINALISRGARRQACTAGAEAGLTSSLQETKLDSKLKLIDSPGIIFPQEIGDAKLSADELAMLGALPLSKIRDPVSAATTIIKRILKSTQMMQMAKELYQLPALITTNEQTTVKDFLVNVARRRGRILKGGIPSLKGAALVILADWNNGRLHWWTEAPRKDSVAGTTGTANGDSSSSVSTDLKKIVTSFSKEFDLSDLFNDTE